MAAVGFNGAMAVRPWMAEGLGIVDLTEPLQWGHGREAMDGRMPHYRYGVLAVLQWGHGREAMDGAAGAAEIPSAKQSFNGAMAVRPWMAGRPCRFASCPSCFNGAMAVRPWMEFRRRRPITLQCASMGPWP